MRETTQPEARKNCIVRLSVDEWRDYKKYLILSGRKLQDDLHEYIVSRISPNAPAR
jgi:hypothetical protein